MEKNELISVIVPVYNIEQYLPACIESILAQTYTNLEIIFIDDGSTDGSGRVCDEYAAKDARIRVIHKPNGGVSSARNVGLDAATGTLIGFVDGDDTIAPEMYQILYSNMCEYKAEISHCGCKIVWRDRVELRGGTSSKMLYNGAQGVRELLSGQNIEPTLWNKLFRVILFENVRLNTDIRVSEDLLANYYLFEQANRIVFDDSCLYHWVRREESCTRSKFSEKNLDPLITARIIMRDLQTKKSEIYIYGELLLVRSLISIYNHAPRCIEYAELRSNILLELKGKRKKMMNSSIYSKTQKIAVLLMTTCPPLYHTMLRIRNYRYRYRKSGN